MESISEKKSLKRKAEEISNDSEAVRKEENDSSTAANNSFFGLCDDILLGEVITKLPWYDRPAIMALSRWWADAMTNSFPYYARLHHPRFLSSSLVLFHNPNSGNPNSPSLWVYNDKNSSLYNLPVPAIPEELRNDVKFVRDDNDERIYSFTSIDENGHKMYDVSVYDLREGNLQWKKLPPLPILEGHSMLSCCSFDNGGCCTSYNIVWIPRIIHDARRDFAVWTLTVRNDVTEWQSQWQPQLDANPDLIDKLIGFDPEEEPSIYLEISIPSDSRNRPLKCLYEMCENSEYSTDYSNALELPHSLLLQFQDDERSAILYYITIPERGEDCEISFYKVKLGNENSTSIDSFWEFWNPWMPFLGPRIESTGTRVLCRRLSQWEKNTFTLSPSVDIDAINLVPRGTLYIYRFAALITV